MVTVKRKKGPAYTAHIKCPYCRANIRSFHTLNGANEIGTWNSSNFGRHLEKVHLKITQNKKTKKRADKSIDDSLDSDHDAIKPNRSSDKNPNENLLAKPNDYSVLTLDDKLVAPAVGSVINMKDVVPITSGETALPALVNCSDTVESCIGDKDYILVEIPSNLDLVMESAVDKGNFSNSKVLQC